MGEVEEKSPLNWSSLIIFYMSFLRVILDDFGAVMRQGLVFIADDQFAAKAYSEVCCEFTCGDAIQVNIGDYKKHKVENYCACIAVLSKVSAEKVEEFLSCQEFFPVVISGGILPDDLRTGHYVIRLPMYDIKAAMLPEFRDYISSVKEYLITNIDIVCRCIRLTETSEAFVKYSKHHRFISYRGLLFRLLAIGEIHRAYVRDVLGEEEELKFYKRYVGTCLYHLDKIADLSDAQDIQEFMVHALWKTLDEGDIYDVTSIDQMDEESLQLFNTEMIILYDDEFYYLRENVLRFLCQPLLNGFSWLELKHKLAEENLIEKASVGFTFKKMITAGTVTTRIRVMKLHKEFLLNSERGLLEDHSIEKEEDTYD